MFWRRRNRDAGRLQQPVVSSDDLGLPHGQKPSRRLVWFVWISVAFALLAISLLASTFVRR